MGIISSFIHSMYDFKSYPKLIKNRFGKVFVHILLLAVISQLVLCASIYSIFENSGSISEIIERIPEFYIENGIAYTDFKVNTITDDGICIIIDTDDIISLEDANEYRECYIIDAEKVIAKKDFKIQSFSFSDFNIDYFDNESLQVLVPIAKILIVIMCVIIFIGLLMWAFLSILILTAIAAIISAMIKKNLAFGELYRLSAYAMTLPFIIKKVFNMFLSPLLGISMPFVIYAVLTIVFVCLALNKADYKDEEEMQLPEQIQ